MKLYVTTSVQLHGVKDDGDGRPDIGLHDISNIEKGIMCQTYVTSSTMMEHTLIYIIFTGDFESMEFLIEKTGILTCNLFDEAARFGYYSIVEFLHQKGCPYDPRACAYAAKGGHLSIVRFFIDHGYAIDTDSCEGAAFGYNLDILRELCDFGVPCSNVVVQHAARNKNHSMMQFLYLYGERCGWCDYDRFWCTYS